MLGQVSRAIVRGGGHNAQLPGETIPFRTNSPARTGIYLVAYLGVGFAAPFLAAKYTLIKNGHHCKW